MGVVACPFHAASQVAVPLSFAWTIMSHVPYRRELGAQESPNQDQDGQVHLVEPTGVGWRSREPGISRRQTITWSLFGPCDGSSSRSTRMLRADHSGCLQVRLGAVQRLLQIFSGTERLSSTHQTSIRGACDQFSSGEMPSNISVARSEHSSSQSGMPRLEGELRTPLAIR